MKLLDACVSNFGSYGETIFNFKNLGLCLISGHTGAGKSTIHDVAPWILFGVTSKNGSVDEVRSWASKSPTLGTLNLVTTDNKQLTVCRKRGTPKENDLFWIENNTTYRGKDLVDTQRLLNARLGLTAEIFCLSTSFNEFSETNQFFTASAKNKRKLFDRLVDLSMPRLLADRVLVAKKEAKETHLKYATEAVLLKSQLDSNQKLLEMAIEDRGLWDSESAIILKHWENKAQYFEAEQRRKISTLTAKHNKFEDSRQQQIDELNSKIEGLNKLIQPTSHFLLRIRELESESSRCRTCGHIASTATLEQYKFDRINNDDRIQKRNEYLQRSIDILAAINPYNIDDIPATNTYLESLELEKSKKNPYIAKIGTLQNVVIGLVEKLSSTDAAFKNAAKRLSALEQVADLCNQLRGVLLNSTVYQIQTDINRHLSQHFDSEISVSFTLIDADELEVTTQKNGHNAVFTQLSKGQRQLLKLCFAITAMKQASNAAGISFNTLFFDEAIEGLDSDLKLKAFGLFQELSKAHDCILVIDHAVELQPLFSKTLRVSLVADQSHIEES